MMKTFLIALALFLIVKGPELFSELQKSQKDYVKEQLVTSYIKNRDNKNILDSLGIRFPDVVLAQMVLETSNLRSDIFKENHNLFGMKPSKKRQKFHEGANRGHAKYNSVLESLKDYKDWQDNMLKDRIVRNDEEYIQFLCNLPGGKRYAEDPQYDIKLRRIIDSWK